jgi:hypothetical protein
MPARGACEPHGRVKVGRRRKGSRGTCERVEDIRWCSSCWRTLTDRCHNDGHSYVLAWPESDLRGKVLMDDIEGILVVVSLYVDGG